ncbi:MAG: MgtC/SapB family protein [Brasilonema octagenarum HA4186-MV1]|jgi:putative Mg2+ transporter-C (MgtC) family protein|nr:MgtC/SapB family protein [Brasilonema octagenarum HA4186-MV1]
MSWLDFTIRLAVAFLLGSVIGVERQWRQRMAGLRTNTLVATGAALFVMLGVMTPGGNPTQVEAYIVSGVGFLGGGVIFRGGASVQGLNTAATLWCVAAVGALAGGGFFPQAFIGTVAVLVANIFLRPVGYRINQQPLKGTEIELCYRCSIVCRSNDEAHVRALLLQAVSATGKMKLRSLHSEDLEETPERVEVEADLVTQDRNDPFLEQIVSRLSLESGVSAVSWKIIEQEYG